MMTQENEKSNAFFIIVEGEFEVVKKVHKPISRDNPTK
jgi:hypothetical protein